MTIQLTQPRVISGSIQAAGSQHTLDEATEAYFVQHGLATYVGQRPYQGGTLAPARYAINASGNVTGLVRPDGLPYLAVAKVFVGTGTPNADDGTAMDEGFGTTIPTSTGAGTYNTKIDFVGTFRDDIGCVDLANNHFNIPTGYSECRLTYNIAFGLNGTGWRGARIRNSSGANYGNVRTPAVAADATTNTYCQTPWLKITDIAGTGAPGQIAAGDWLAVYPAQTSGGDLVAGADSASSFVQIEFR